MAPVTWEVPKFEGGRADEGRTHRIDLSQGVLRMYTTYTGNNVAVDMDVGPLLIMTRRQREDCYDDEHGVLLPYTYNDGRGNRHDQVAVAYWDVDEWRINDSDRPAFYARLRVRAW